MAQLTASNAAPYGNSGAYGRLALYAAGRPQPISLRHAYLMVRERGGSGEYYAKVGAKHTASAESEGAAAATPSALNTPTGQELNPAGFLISLAINSAAFTRTLEENDPGEIAKDEIAYGCGIYLMDDGTVGMGALYDTVTASGGNTGAKLTVGGALGCGSTIRQNMDDANLVISHIVDGKGADDLAEDLRDNASAHLGNPNLTNYIAKAVAQDAQVFDEDDGFWFALTAKDLVYVEGGFGMLIQQGGDRVGCAMISDTKAIVDRAQVLPKMQDPNTRRRISPAFAMCVEEDPIRGLRDATIRVEDLDTPSGPVVITTDADIGNRYIAYRGRGMGSVELVNDNGACEERYLA